MSNCLYSKLRKGREECKKLDIDLNLPASSNETELTQNITNSDDEALSQYAGTEIRKSEYEYQQQPFNSRPHNHNSNSDSVGSSQKDGSRKKKSSSSSGLVKWTKQVKVSLEIGLEVPPNDGYMWRKYGQKEILHAKYPREYYRCTYRNTHECCATKQVQRSSEDPSIFDITYLGKHTCPKTHDPTSATQSAVGYSLIDFSSTSHSSFELSNWPLNHN